MLAVHGISAAIDARHRVDNAGAVLSRYLLSLVIGSVIDHDDLVGEAKRFERAPERAFLIVGVEESRNTLHLIGLDAVSRLPEKVSFH